MMHKISVDKVVLVPVKTHNNPADDSKEQPFANPCETTFEDRLKVYSWSPTLYKAPFPKQGHRTALGQSSSKTGHTGGNPTQGLIGQCQNIYLEISD